jgi:hypothetical protein
MFRAIEEALPLEWRGAFRLLAAPLVWVAERQSEILEAALFADSPGAALAKWVFLSLPLGLLVVALWSTMLSLYTVPFRSGRGEFLSSLLLSWWDVGRMVVFYYAGLVRWLVVAVGWLWGISRAAVRLLWGAFKGAFASPFVFLDWTSRTYFKPGVPWLAFFLVLLWSGLEAVVFTLTLRPLMTELLADLAGFEPDLAAVTAVLWVLLFLLISGSFAAIQALTEAVARRDAGRIVSMVLVEFFVMGFEILFLYRELVDAITPWIAQATGYELGLAGTLGLAAGGWVGVRGMTWFLFGRYGTPALLGVLARQRIRREDETAAWPVPESPDLWSAPIAALKRDAEWFQREGREVFQLLALPVLQLLAAAVNFAVVVVRSRPVFRLPFRDLDEVLQTTPFSGWPAVRPRAARTAPAAPVPGPAGEGA